MTGQRKLAGNGMRPLYLQMGLTDDETDRLLKELRAVCVQKHKRAVNFKELHKGEKER